MAPLVIHHRAETKEFERRSPLSPRSAEALIEAGYVLKVESSKDRIYRDEEYAAVGAEIVPTGSWVDAPKDHIILGLKEFPLDEERDYPHTYIHFQHCFKGQTGWDKAVDRFSRAGGTLYDLEFLEQVRREGGKKDGKPILGEDGEPAYVRTAAFGWSAGYAGTAIALLAWAHQVLHPGVPQGEVKPFNTTEDLIKHVKEALVPAVEKEGGRRPHTVVIGALGRCGKGAIAFLEAVGFKDEHITKWDQEETRDNPGPYDEVAEADIFVNAVYLTTKIPPFITFESLSKNPKRRLRVVTDVSCDPNSELNPVPIYSEYSSFRNPTVATAEPPSEEFALGEPELRIISIDHLPTFVALEASNEFSDALLNSLLALKDRHTDPVWTRAEKKFKATVNKLPEPYRSRSLIDLEPENVKNKNNLT